MSHPGSPSLAAAVALAAGRFQPLSRWETSKHFGDVLSLDEARTLCLDLEARIADRIPMIVNEIGWATHVGKVPITEDQRAAAYGKMTINYARARKIFHGVTATSGVALALMLGTGNAEAQNVQCRDGANNPVGTLTPSSTNSVVCGDACCVEHHPIEALVGRHLAGDRQCRW